MFGDSTSTRSSSALPATTPPGIGPGRYDMGSFIELCDEIGYTGAIGCEYTPQNGTEAGLSWASRYGIGS